MVRGGVREPLLDRRAVDARQDQGAAAGSRHHDRGELSDPLRAEEKECEQPGGGRHRAATREGEVATQRHDRDGRCRRGLSPEGSSRGGDRQQQRQAERHQRRERIPVVQRPAEPSGGAGEERGGLIGGREQIRAQPRGEGQAGDHHHGGGDRMDRVLHGPRAIPMDRDAEQEHAEVARDPREVLQAALRAQRPDGGKCGPRDEAREQGQRDPGRARPPTGREQPPGRSDEHDPPDDDRHLAPHDLVIAAPVDREVEHDRAGERPRPHGVRLDPTQGVRPPRGRPAHYRFHRSSIRASISWLTRRARSRAAPQPRCVQGRLVCAPS